MTSQFSGLDTLLAPADDDERREGDWLQARDDDPNARPPSEMVARDHAQLVDLLTTLPVGRDDDRWQEAVLAAAHTEPDAAVPRLAGDTRRIRWGRFALLAGGVAVAVLAIYLGTRPAGSPTTELQVAIIHAGSTRGSAGEVAVGDELVVRARPEGPTELRVYEDQRLLLRCPGPPGCAAGDASWRVTLRLTAPVRHHVILVFGDVQVPRDAPLHAFLDAARTAGLRTIVHPPIDVR